MKNAFAFVIRVLRRQKVREKLSFEVKTLLRDVRFSQQYSWRSEPAA
jgi:hypothetical protein